MDHEAVHRAEAGEEAVGLPTGSSVVIPAHNEARVIGRSLELLLSGRDLLGATVVVACNGCDDDTVARARDALDRLDLPALVLDLSAPSKVAAIRAAERLCPQGPRLYLDADVDCSGATAAALLRAVGPGAAPVAVPRRELDLAAAGVLSRSYYGFWSGLPWVRRQLSGRGAYALSATVRSRFDEFPDVQADDRWATTLAPADEAVVVPAAVTVRPAPTIGAVVRVRTRIYSGNRDAHVPTHDASGGQRSGALLRYVARPRQWAGLLVFCGVTVLAKVRARRARAVGEWGRDPLRGGRDEAGAPRAPRPAA